MEGTFERRLTNLHGLRCEDCELNAALRRSRGCGVAPLHPRTGEPWRPAEFLERARRAGLKRADIAAQVVSEYPLANLGKVWERRDWLWPCCPKSLTRADVVRRSTMRQAQFVLVMVDAVRRHDAGRVRARPLTAHGLQVVRDVERMWEELAAERDEQSSSGGGQLMPPRRQEPARRPMSRGPRRPRRR